eukprot:Hpha_TRINITY_DN22355_c0_g1::TRINITY_DN22355_c0_g1_i1::g.177805::m.177805
MSTTSLMLGLGDAECRWDTSGAERGGDARRGTNVSEDSRRSTGRGGANLTGGVSASGILSAGVLGALLVSSGFGAQRTTSGRFLDWFESGVPPPFGVTSRALTGPSSPHPLGSGGTLIRSTGGVAIGGVTAEGLSIGGARGCGGGAGAIGSVG